MKTNTDTFPEILLRAFAKQLRKTDISFFMSVCTGQLSSFWTDNRENLYR